MANKIDIEIGAIDSASGVLGNVFQLIRNGVNAFDLIATAALTAANFVRESTQEAFDYDQQIKSLMITTGGTAEATSRLVQTLDDAGIGYDTVTKAMKEMSKDGTEPNIQELARLSDEFKSLNTGAEKGKFLLDNFGKSGESMARAMEMGGDSLLRMYSEMEGGLIITQSAIDEAETYRMNIDTLNDSWMGFKVTLGNQVIPVINSSIAAQADYNEKLQQVIELYGNHGDRANNMRVLMMQEHDATIAAADAVAAHGDALDGAVTSTSSLGAATALTTQEINDMTKANNEQMSLIKKLDNIQKDYNTSLAEMTAEFGAGSQEVKNLQADHQSALNSIAYDLYLARLAVDGFTDAERIAAEKAGVAMGIISQEAVDLSYKFIDNADKVGTFGTTAQSSFMTAKESAMDAKSEAVAYGQSIAEASVDREVTVTFHGVTTGNGWDVVNTGSGCFTRGTKVLMDTNTYQSIEDVLIGDFVKSYDVDNGVFVSAKVTNTFVHIVNKLVVINGIETTPEHPFYANGQWIKAGALKIGDVIFLESDEFAEVTTINTREETTTVYNIEVENTHNYFAGGVLVHNKEAQLAPHGAMSSPYAAQQTTQTFDYQMFAVVLRDVLSQFFK